MLKKLKERGGEEVPSLEGITYVRQTPGVRKPLSLDGITYVRQKPEAPKGDSWGKLISKSIIDKGLGPLLDLPNLVAQGIEGIARGGVEDNRRLLQSMGLSDNDVETPEFTGLSSNIPTYADAREYLKDNTGIDFQVRPTSGAQRIASEAIGFATPGGLLGLFGKGAKALNAAKTGAVIGGTSGALQETGVNPLTADLVSIFGLPTAARAVSNTGKAAGNLFSNFTKAGQEKKIQSAAGDILRNKVGEQNINKVLANLEAPTPFGADLNTAERAQNTGISSLHRALAPNVPAIAEKEAITDSILRNQLNQLSPQIGTEPYRQGEFVRNYLDKELQGRIANRSAVTAPLYEEVNALRKGLDLPNFNNFLQKEGEFARGDIAKAFDYLGNIVQGKTTTAQNKKLINDIEKYTENLSPRAKEQIKSQVGAGNKPIPPEITAALKDISGKIDAAKTAGNKELARVLSEGKANLLKDMAAIPEERIARETYAKLSKPVSAIEKQPLLKKIVKKDIYNNDFLTSPEKIPEMIARGSVNDTKALISEIGSNKKALDTVRGAFVDKLTGTSQLAAANASGMHNLSYPKLNNFLKKNKEKLKYVFNEDQIKVLDDVKDILKRRNAVSTMGRGVGSNTQSQTTLLEGLTDPVKKSLFKKFLHQIPGGKYASPFIEGAKNYEKQQITNLLEKALLDPKTAKTLLTPLDKIKSKESLKSILRKRSPIAIYSVTKRKQEEE